MKVKLHCGGGNNARKADMMDKSKPKIPKGRGKYQPRWDILDAVQKIKIVIPQGEGPGRGQKIFKKKGKFHQDIGLEKRR